MSSEMGCFLDMGFVEGDFVPRISTAPVGFSVFGYAEGFGLSTLCGKVPFHFLLAVRLPRSEPLQGAVRAYSGIIENLVIAGLFTE